MSLFSVRLLRTRRVIEQAEIEISADSAAEAIAMAKEDEDLEWTAIDQETDEPTCSASPIG